MIIGIKGKNEVFIDDIRSVVDLTEKDSVIEIYHREHDTLYYSKKHSVNKDIAAQFIRLYIQFLKGNYDAHKIYWLYEYE